MVSTAPRTVRRIHNFNTRSTVEHLERRSMLTADADLALVLGDSLADQVHAATTDAGGNIYVVGCARGTVDLAPGKAVHAIKSRGDSDAFVAKYSPEGSLVWFRQLGGTSRDDAVALTLTPAGNVVLAGTFKRVVNLLPTRAAAAATAWTGRGNTDVFVLSLTDQGEFQWLRHLGGTGPDTVTAIASSPSGDLALAGNFAGTLSAAGQKKQPVLRSAGRQDGFVWRLDKGGKTKSAFSFGGTADDTAHDVALDVAGAVYATGSFVGTADFQPGGGTSNLTSAGERDAFVAAWDASNNLRRTVALGGARDDAGYGIALDSPSGNVYVTGQYAGAIDFDPGGAASTLTSVSGTHDAFLLKLDRNLAFSMAKSIGGAGTDVGYDVAIDAGGSIYVGGAFEDTPDFDTGFGEFKMTSAGKGDGFVVKLAPSGSFAYARQIGGSRVDAVRGLSIAADDSVIAIGTFKNEADFDPGEAADPRSSKGLSDGFVWRLNQRVPSFNLARNFAGVGDKSLPGFAISRADYIYSAGRFTGTLTLGSGDEAIRYNSRGQDDIWIGKACNKCLLRWAWSIGGSGSDAATGTAVLPDGSMLVAGWFSGTVDFDPGPSELKLTSAGGRDAFVMRLDADGNVKWAQRHGGVGDDAATAIAAEGGDVYVTGTFRSTGTFGTTTLSSVGGDDVFLARLIPTGGDVAWAVRTGGSGDDAAAALAIDGRQNVIVAGRFDGEVDFDAGVDLRSLVGADDAFVWKMTRGGAFAWARPIALSGSGVSSIATDAGDNVYLAGSFTGSINFDGDEDDDGGTTAPVSSAGGSDGFVARLDAAGTLRVARTFGGAGDDSAACVTVDRHRANVYVSGSFHDQLRYDDLTLSSAGQSDAFLLTIDGSGNLLWGGRAGGAADDFATHVLLGGGGSFLYVAGTFAGTGDFDLTDGAFTLNPGGARDIFVTRLIQ